MAEGEGGAREGGGVRLSPDEVVAIKDAAAQAFGDSAIVRLFGSRVDDAARGGDIDLLIEVAPGRTGIVRESYFLSELFRRIDEQKVDLVLVEHDRPPSPFARMIASKAVLLS